MRPRRPSSKLRQDLSRLEPPTESRAAKMSAAIVAHGSVCRWRHDIPLLQTINADRGPKAAPRRAVPRHPERRRSLAERLAAALRGAPRARERLLIRRACSRKTSFGDPGPQRRLLDEVVILERVLDLAQHLGQLGADRAASPHRARGLLRRRSARRPRPAAWRRRSGAQRAGAVLRTNVSGSSPWGRNTPRAQSPASRRRESCAPRHDALRRRRRKRARPRRRGAGRAAPGRWSARCRKPATTLVMPAWDIAITSR